MEAMRLPEDFSTKLDNKMNATLAFFDQLRNILDEQAIISITDSRGTITYANELFCKISGYSRNELIGSSHSLINSKYHPADFFRNLWKTIAKGFVWHGVICNKAKDSSLYWVRTSIYPFRSPTGEIESYVSVRVDITELIQNNHDIEKLNEKLASEHKLLESRTLTLKQLLNDFNQGKRKSSEAIQLNLKIAILPEIDRIENKCPSLHAIIQKLKGHLKEISDSTSTNEGTIQRLFEKLTEKEIEVCEWIQQGLSIKEIASNMAVSERHH